MKAFTDLEQSKKLAEILPLESADMYWKNGISDKYIQCFTPFVSDDDRSNVDFEYDVPCWSLAALLEVLDDIVVDDEGNEYSLTISKEEGMYYIYYHDRWEEVNDIETDCYYDYFVDACYEMIIKLHEQKLL